MACCRMAGRTGRSKKVIPVMISSHLVAWVWYMMLQLQPATVTPWAETYESTAKVFAEEATLLPLFSGSDGARRTAALFLSVAWFEGKFNPQAKGDCKNGKCESLCMFQIGRSNVAGLKVTEEQLLSDVRVCTQAARKMMQISFGVCRGRPKLDILGHYASGGATCGGLRESRHRMQKAEWIFNQRETP
jgi:hypothetical protein